MKIFKRILFLSVLSVGSAFADIPSNSQFFLTEYRNYEAYEPEYKEARESFTKPCDSVVKLKYQSYRLTQEKRWDHKQFQYEVYRSSIPYSKFLNFYDETTCGFTEGHGDCRIKVNYIQDVYGDRFRADIEILLCTAV